MSFYKSVVAFSNFSVLSAFFDNIYSFASTFFVFISVNVF